MIYCPFVALIMLTVICSTLVSVFVCLPEDKLHRTKISELVLLSLICSFVQLQLATPRDKRITGLWFLIRAHNATVSFYLSFWFPAIRA